MATFYVNGNLNHDNHLYKPGDPIELTEDQAAPHLASGIILLPEDHEAKETARNLEAQAAIARDRVGAPKVEDAQAPKAPEPEAKPDGKEIVEEPDGTTAAEEDAKGAEGEQSK